ncbi:MAG: hypothetical protein C5B47_04885 [Verrucomicrobia bacterium]|nr:MAG: hypothetical protein C5B47_04885 [Verrucomicrobiota bacterium]
MGRLQPLGCHTSRARHIPTGSGNCSFKKARGAKIEQSFHRVAPHWKSDEQYRNEVFLYYKESGSEAWETIKKLNRSLDEEAPEQTINKVLHQLDSLHPSCSTADLRPSRSPARFAPRSTTDVYDDRILTQLSIKIQEESSIEDRDLGLRILEFLRFQTSPRCSPKNTAHIREALQDLVILWTPFFRKQKYQAVEADLIKFREALERSEKNAAVRKKTLERLSRFCEMFIRCLRDSENFSPVVSKKNDTRVAQQMRGREAIKSLD